MDFSPIKRSANLSDQIQKILQILRYGQREKIVFLLAVLLFALAFAVNSVEVAFMGEYKSNLVLVLRFVAAGFIVLGVILVWQKVIPPPEIELVSKPLAIKGPFAFSKQDGELFRQLGRSFELQQVCDQVINDQVSFIVVVGESGVGKSSLLRAGVEFAFSTGKTPERIPCIYWEALPTNAEASLLDTIQLRWQENEQDSQKPESIDELLSELAWPRHVILIDQAEQLNPADHPEMFDLYEKMMSIPSGHPITWVIAFREEYLVTWSKYLISKRIPYPPSITIERFSTEQARRVMATLANASNMNLSESVMRDLLETISQENGQVSPVDIGISLLVLSELGREKQTIISERVYQQAGKAEGLLASYIENHLRRLPEYARESVLKALIGLFDLETDQRIAEGKSAEQLSSVVSLPVDSLKSHLAYMASPRVRILQELIESNPDHTPDISYRLSHERIIPALRRLSGRILAEAEQARILLERRFKVWNADRQRRDLLTRSELKDIAPYVGQFEWGENRDQKQVFLASSRRSLHAKNLLLVVTLLATISFLSWGWRWQSASSYTTMLAKVGVPSFVYEQANQLDTLVIESTSLLYGKWKKTALDSLSIQIGDGSSNEILLPDSLQKLNLSLEGSLLTNFSGISFPQGVETIFLKGSGSIASLEGLSLPESITQLSLDLSSNQVESLEGLSLPESITQLSLYLGYNQVESLEGLSLPESITQLSLYLNNDVFQGANQVESLEGLSLPESITELSLDLSGNQVESLEGLSLPESITELSLDLSGNQVESLEGLSLPESITQLSLDLGYNQVESLEGLSLPESITQLSLYLSGNQVESLEGLSLPESITELSLDLSGNQVESLEGLSLPESITELSLDLRGNQVESLEGLSLPESITELSLDLDNVNFQGGNQVQSLEGLSLPESITQLSLDLGSNQVQSLEGLSLPESITELSLYLGYNQVESLEGLSLPESITELSLYLGGNQVESLEGLSLPESITQLSLSLSGNQVESLEGLSLPESITQLSLSLSGNQIQSLEGLSLPESITELSLDLSGNQVESLEGLSLPESITELSLYLGYNQVESLEGLSLPESITELSLDLNNVNFQGGNQVESLEGLSLPESITELSLDLGSNQVESLEGLSLPESITQLSLDLSGNQVESLEGLSLPESITELSLDLSGNQVESLEGLSLPESITELSLDLRGNRIYVYGSFPDSLKSLRLNIGFTIEHAALSTLNFPEGLEKLNVLSSNLSSLTGLPSSVKDARLYIQK